MKAPGDKRPTWRGGIIQIHITRACDLACVSCTQGSNLAGKPTVMTLDNFRRACISLKDYYGVIGIFGGNPTIHPDFEEICEIFREIIPFEQRGLWSNNLHKHGKLCRKTFNPAVSNLNVHGMLDVFNKMKQDWPECNPIGDMNDSRHSPPFVAMKDLGYTDTEIREKIEKCDVNQLWSAMVCQFRGELRGYFCELAGAQSMLHENEDDYPDTGVRVFPGWWSMPMGVFENQVRKHCWECGIPLKIQGDLSQGNNEYVSESHRSIYKLKKPQSKILHLVTKDDILKTVHRATDYVANGVEQMENPELKILIGVPTAEYARRADFYDYFNALDKPNGTIITMSHGQSPARNRNLIIRQALDHNCTHVFFLDDDVAFRQDLLTNLLKHDKDLVTGLYLMRNFPHRPIIFDWANEKGECAFKPLDDTEYGLVPIRAAGLGACLIKTSVFKKLDELMLSVDKHGIKDRWVTLGELDTDHWCDDISFYNRCAKAGIEMYCDMNSLVGHIASVIVWPDVINNEWMTTYDTGSPEGRASVRQVTVQVKSAFEQQLERKQLVEGVA